MVEFPRAWKYTSNPAQRQPVQNLVSKINPQKFPTTKTILEDIIRANYELKWNTTYSENEVGTDFIKKYGWFDLIGPNGPFYMSGTRIMMGYWGPIWSIKCIGMRPKRRMYLLLVPQYTAVNLGFCILILYLIININIWPQQQLGNSSIYAREGDSSW